MIFVATGIILTVLVSQKMSLKSSQITLILLGNVCLLKKKLCLFRDFERGKPANDEAVRVGYGDFGQVVVG